MSVDYDDERGKEKKEKEILVLQDEDTFEHETGDTYQGFFEAKKKDMSIKMNGPGKYTTAEGDVYEGMWSGNYLGGDQEVTITYHGGSTFKGSLKDFTYQGRGTYIYPDSTRLCCNFSENFPVGELKLIDPNGHLWSAKADVGFAVFSPVNHYYAMLDRTPVEKPKKKRRPKEIEPVPRILEPDEVGPKKKVMIK